VSRKKKIKPMSTSKVRFPFYGKVDNKVIAIVPADVYDIDKITEAVYRIQEHFYLKYGYFEVIK
jgi:hypothetical protein